MSTSHFDRSGGTLPPVVSGRGTGPRKLSMLSRITKMCPMGRRLCAAVRRTVEANTNLGSVLICFFTVEVPAVVQQWPTHSMFSHQRCATS